MRKRLLMILYFAVGGFLCLLGFWMGQVRGRETSFWTSEVDQLPGYGQADPCIQVALFIESEARSDHVVEPFSPYHLPVGAHVFHAEPPDVARCALDIGEILVSYIQTEELSKRERQGALRRLLGVTQILCSEDFSLLPPDLAQRRQILLRGMEDRLPPEYRKVKINIEYYCNQK